MKRRESLKLIAASALAGGTLAGCDTKEKEKKAENGKQEFSLDRNPDEIKRENELLAKEKFFTEHEMATITILADIIIPKDEVSGSASDAKVPEFIEFIVKDMPNHQVPLRGGLRWLDMQSLKRFEKTFRESSPEQQMSLVNEIAYPEKAKPEMKQGAKFFSLMRNLTATGFYTSSLGFKDLGYAGNSANQWNGVPAEVLQQYNVAYTDKEIKECVQYQ
jgi:gluconate 2-dehydrogenase gamma chain